MKALILAQKKTQYETKRIIEEFTKLNIRSDVVKPSSIDVIVSREDKTSIRIRGSVVPLPDVVIPRTGSGTGYFSLAVLRQFERLKVPLCNSSLGIENVKDKFYAHQLMVSKGLPIPKTILAKKNISVALVQKQIGFPCVVKIVTGSYGEGVYLSRDRKSFKDLIELIDSLNSKSSVLIQEFVAEKFGTDIRVLVIGNECIGAIERKSTDGSFKANLTRGGVAKTIDITKDIQNLSLKAARDMNLDIAGVDLLYDKKGLKICEVNSAPGFEGFERSTNINVAEKICRLALSKVKPIAI